MPRPFKKKRIFSKQKFKYFKPIEIPLKELNEVIISFEEMEALRLKDLNKNDQTISAKKMGIHQSTFQRLLTRAREKLIFALVNGYAIKIDGGNFKMEENKMKNNEYINKIIAFASNNNDVNNAKISPVSGRAKYYHIFKDGKFLKTIENPYSDSRGGVARGLTQLLINEDVDLVVAGNFGENIKLFLSENGIDFKEVEIKSIKDFIEN